MSTTADNYKYIQADELRELCAFKDRTIEILQDALSRAQMPPLAKVHTFVDVTFGPDCYPYTYLSGGIDIDVGDTVVVPVGNSGREVTATVVNLYNSSKASPLAYKTILRKGI